MKIPQKLLWRVGRNLIFLLVFGTAFWTHPALFAPVESGILDVEEYCSGIENHSVQVAGHHVHYLAEGPNSGPPVVLIHGLGGNAEDWLELARYLGKAGYRVYLPDLIGYGRSDKPAEFSYSVPNEAEVVIGFLDVLGLRQVDLGGWSMGGWIVQEVASQQPARVRRLILINAAGLNVKPDWDARLFTPATPAELREFFALLMPNPPKLPDLAARIFVHIRQEQYWVIRRAISSMLNGRDATDNLLPNFRMPVLIVWGELDRVFPLKQGETMHRLVPQSQLEVIPGCGHRAPRQCADQIGPKLVEFEKRQE